MRQRDPPTPPAEGHPGHDFRRITGIGKAIDRRLHEAGVVTYHDLATRTSEEIAVLLADAPRVSPDRIESEDWAGQARKLADSESAPAPSDQPERRASFRIELLLGVDNAVRRTTVRHDQTDAEETWPGWDEARLLTFLRDRVPPPTTGTPLSDGDDLDAPSSNLPPSFLTVEELISIRDGERRCIRQADEPTSVRLVLRIDPTDMPEDAMVDFEAEIAARELGGHERTHLGTAYGSIGVNKPVSVEVTGPPLPSGLLYRLAVRVAIYAADHATGAYPLLSRSASGDLIQVGKTLAETQHPTA